MTTQFTSVNHSASDVSTHRQDALEYLGENSACVTELGIAWQDVEFTEGVVVGEHTQQVLAATECKGFEEHRELKDPNKDSNKEHPTTSIQINSDILKHLYGDAEILELRAIRLTELLQQGYSLLLRSLTATARLLQAEATQLQRQLDELNQVGEEPAADSSDSTSSSTSTSTSSSYAASLAAQRTSLQLRVSLVQERIAQVEQLEAWWQAHNLEELEYCEYCEYCECSESFKSPKSSESPESLESLATHQSTTPLSVLVSICHEFTAWLEAQDGRYQHTCALWLEQLARLHKPLRRGKAECKETISKQSLQGMLMHGLVSLWTVQQSSLAHAKRANQVKQDASVASDISVASDTHVTSDTPVTSATSITLATLNSSTRSTQAAMPTFPALAGISGGADSQFLAFLLWLTSPQVELVVIDHQLSSLSPSWGACVAACQAGWDKLGLHQLPVQVLRVQVGVGNLEAQARVARYREFARVLLERVRNSRGSGASGTSKARRISSISGASPISKASCSRVGRTKCVTGSECVVEVGMPLLYLGHQRDDYLEQYFLHLQHGSNPSTLNMGIAPVRQVRIATSYQGVEVSLPVQQLRPLLDFSKEEITCFLDYLLIAWADDPMNADERFQRVAYRQMLSANHQLGQGVLASTALAQEQLVQQELQLLPQVMHAGIASVSSPLGEECKEEKTGQAWDFTLLGQTALPLASCKSLLARQVLVRDLLRVQGQLQLHYKQALSLPRLQQYLRSPSARQGVGELLNHWLHQLGLPQMNQPLVERVVREVVFSRPTATPWVGVKISDLSRGGYLWVRSYNQLQLLEDARLIEQFQATARPALQRADLQVTPYVVHSTSYSTTLPCNLKQVSVGGIAHNTICEELGVLVQHQLSSVVTWLLPKQLQQELLSQIHKPHNKDRNQCYSQNHNQNHGQSYTQDDTSSHNQLGKLHAKSQNQQYSLHNNHKLAQHHNTTPQLDKQGLAPLTSLGLQCAVILSKNTLEHEQSLMTCDLAQFAVSGAADLSGTSHHTQETSHQTQEAPSTNLSSGDVSNSINISGRGCDSVSGIGCDCSQLHAWLRECRMWQSLGYHVYVLCWGEQGMLGNRAGAHAGAKVTKGTQNLAASLVTNFAAELAPEYVAQLAQLDYRAEGAYSKFLSEQKIHWYYRASLLLPALSQVQQVGRGWLVRCI